MAPVRIAGAQTSSRDHHPRAPVATRPVEVVDDLGPQAILPDLPEVDPLVLRAIPWLINRLGIRHPGAPVELIRSLVHQADRETRGARVTVYLPILMERRAAAALRQAGW
jgi:hypothetical protein